MLDHAQARSLLRFVQIQRSTTQMGFNAVRASGTPEAAVCNASAERDCTMEQFKSTADVHQRASGDSDPVNKESKLGIIKLNC